MCHVSHRWKIRYANLYCYFRYNYFWKTLFFDIFIVLIFQKELKGIDMYMFLGCLMCRSSSHNRWDSGKMRSWKQLMVKCCSVTKKHNKQLIARSLLELFRFVVGIDLDIYEGQITALLGHNGAGKTTLINMMTGVMPVTKGTAFLYDYVSILLCYRVWLCTSVCTSISALIYGYLSDFLFASILYVSCVFLSKCICICMYYMGVSAIFTMFGCRWSLYLFIYEESHFAVPSYPSLYDAGFIKKNCTLKVF